jgi:hypothetical protein
VFVFEAATVLGTLTIFSPFWSLTYPTNAQYSSLTTCTMDKMAERVWVPGEVGEDGLKLSMDGFKKPVPKIYTY